MKAQAMLMIRINPKIYEAILKKKKSIQITTYNETTGLSVPNVFQGT